jgi:hypothetical protein
MKEFFSDPYIFIVSLSIFGALLLLAWFEIGFREEDNKQKS